MDPSSSSHTVGGDPPLPPAGADAVAADLMTRAILAPVFGSADSSTSGANASVARMLGKKLRAPTVWDSLKRAWKVFLFEVLYLSWLSSRYSTPLNGDESACPRDDNANPAFDNHSGRYQFTGMIVMLVFLVFLIFVVADVLKRRFLFFNYLAHDVAIDFKSTMDPWPTVWSARLSHAAALYWKIVVVLLANFYMFYAGACERDWWGAHNRTGLIFIFTTTYFAYELITFDSHDLLPFPAFTKMRTGMRHELRSGWGNLVVVSEREMRLYFETRRNETKNHYYSDEAAILIAVAHVITDKKAHDKYVKLIREGAVFVVSATDVRAFVSKVRREEQSGGHTKWPTPHSSCCSPAAEWLAARSFSLVRSLVWAHGSPKLFFESPADAGDKEAELTVFEPDDDGSA